MKYRRFLVAIDASPASLAAARAAADLASHLSAELEGVFVRDHELLSLAGSPLARRLDLLTASIRNLETQELETELSEQAARARGHFADIAARAGVEHRFRIAQGIVAEEIARAAEEVDLVSLGTLGWSSRSRARLGRTVRELLARPEMHTLVLERWVGIESPVRVIFDGSDTAHRAVELAARIASASGQAIEVFLVGEDRATLERAAGETLRDTDLEHTFVHLEDGTDELLERLAAGGRGLLLLPRDLTALDVAAVLERLESPVLLVGG